MADDSPTQPEGAALLIGRVLGERYRIDAMLGEGGMGTVYRGTQLSVERQVAIKLISPLLAREREVIERFKREAQVTSQLRQPHNVQLVDFGSTDEGQMYLVMELLKGRELSELLAEGPLARERALTITDQVLKALIEAHDLGIVHRDLKPANIFLCDVAGEEDFAKVMDFGIASALEGDNRQLTMTGTLVGTPAYMSPEQAQGQPVGPTSDLYSLGVILYEMLTGRGPFESNTAMSLLMMHVSKAPPPLHETAPGLPQLQALQALLDRLLAKAPADRFQSAVEARERVRALLDGDDSVPVVAAAGSGAAVASSEAPPAAGGAVLSPRRKAALGTAAVLVLLGVGAAVTSEDAPSPPPAPPQPPIVAEPAPPAPPQAQPDTPAQAPITGPATDAPAPAQAAPARRTPKTERATRPPAPARSKTPQPKPTVSKDRSPTPPKPPPAVRALEIEDRKQRRNTLLKSGSPYNNVRDAKTAYRAGRLSKAQYSDVVWALKRRRKQQIARAKEDYAAMRIGRQEYKRRVKEIDRAYEGR